MEERMTHSQERLCRRAVFIAFVIAPFWYVYDAMTYVMR